MNIRYLLCAAAILFSVSASAQLNSDDPSLFNSGAPLSKPVYSESKILGTNVIPPCDSGSAMIIASGECGYSWSSDSAGLNTLAGNDTLITGNLSTDTVFYVATTGATPGTDTLMTIPTHGSNFSGNVRGYYFQAPVDIIITKLRVPTEASSGTQNVAVLKFNSGPPPLWSVTTNDFVEEGYWTNVTADTIFTCINVSAGDYIGIYGNRADVNSYSGAPYATNIAGFPVTLTRSGMQLPLSSNPMSNVFSEAAGSLSRTEMYYTTSFDTLTPVAINVTLGQTYNNNATANICAGDSALIGGSYYFSDTTVIDSAFAITGCDSITSTVLTVHAPQATNDSLWICQGDSIMIGGSVYGSAGIIIDSSSVSQYGCDSTSTVTLIVNPLPTVTLGAFSQDTICIQLGTIALPAGSPVGCIYSGTGVSGTNFDAAVSGVGTFTVSYNYADSTGCANVATADITVVNCIGVEEHTVNLTSIYPNPAADQLTIDANNNQIETVKIVDALGRTIDSYANVSGTIQVNVNNYAPGVYFVIARNGANYQSQRFVKK